mgnify:CR=1 FL=1
MIGIFLGYLALTVILGLWQARRTRSQADFVLGSSRLPGWMLALSERATGESAWLLLGLTGFVYANGLSAIWIAVGCLTGISTAWVVLARRFRSEAERYRALTMPDYFSAKFPEKAYAIRLLSTLIIVFFFVFYVGAQFAGAGKTLHATFGLDPFWGQLIAAAAIIGYSAFGGFVSVVAVDSLQAVLMILTLVVTPIVMLIKVMLGPVSIGAALHAAGGGMDSLTGTASGFGAGVLILTTSPGSSATWAASPSSTPASWGCATTGRCGSAATSPWPGRCSRMPARSRSACARSYCSGRARWPTPRWFFRPR